MFSLKEDRFGWLGISGMLVYNRTQNNAFTPHFSVFLLLPSSSPSLFLIDHSIAYDGMLRPTSVSFTTNELLYITHGTTQAILG